MVLALLVPYQAERVNMIDIIEKLYPARFKEFKKKVREMEFAVEDERYKLYQDMFSEQERAEIGKRMEKRYQRERGISLCIWTLCTIITFIVAVKAASVGWHTLYVIAPPWLWLIATYWQKLVGTYSIPRDLWSPLETITTEAYGFALALGVMIWLATHPPC